MCFFFFFKQKTAYEMRISDWSSDVCSSDLTMKLRLPLLLPAGCEALDPIGIGRWIGANVDARRRALQDMELLRVTPEIRDRLHRRRTGADDRNPLIGQAVEFRLLPAAAGVAVVPTRGVEDLALERRQSGKERQSTRLN